jgi:hypothetical protein
LDVVVQLSSLASGATALAEIWLLGAFFLLRNTPYRFQIQRIEYAIFDPDIESENQDRSEVRQVVDSRSFWEENQIDLVDHYLNSVRPVLEAHPLDTSHTPEPRRSMNILLQMIKNGVSVSCRWKGLTSACRQRFQ